MEPGRILDDRYEILRPIAEGASSRVWEARDARSGSVVAVKAVSMEEAGWRAEVRDRFEKEGRLLELVESAHLVRVRDRGETDDGYLYLVLDRLRGETLAERLARAPRLTWREGASIVRDLAAGAAALHARGIVHRDLKPANVILHAEGAREGGAPSPAPVCKIIDLGISRASAAAADPVLFATLTATGQVLGTPEYMSYEQALGERDVDARTDVWSLGVIAYELLSGRRPFGGAHPNAVLAAIRRGSPPPLREAPPALAAVVARCLSRARDDRPRDGAALAREIDAAVLAQSRRGRRIVASVIVALAAAALAALVVRRAAPARPELAAPMITDVSAQAARVEPPSADTMGPQASPAPTPTQTPKQAHAPPTGRTPKSVTRVDSAGF